MSSIVQDCPECAEPMTVEVPGSKVACPHCGAEVATKPATDEGLDTDSVLEEPGPPKIGDSFASLAALAAAEDFDELPAMPVDRDAHTTISMEGLPPNLTDADDAPTLLETPAVSTAPEVGSVGSSPPDLADAERSASVGVDPDALTVEFHRGPTETAKSPVSTEPTLADTTAAAPVSSATQERPRATVPRSWFVLALTYGSVMTILFVGLLFDIKNGGLALRWLDPPPHQLESLPDIVEASDLRIVPEDAELPRGHVLAIGDERRFGDLRVKVVEVTREPVVVEYSDILGGDAGTLTSEVPVLQLHLEIENLSTDDSISPLDRVLLFTRGRTTKGGGQRCNQFVCRVDEQRTGGALIRPYRLGEGASSNFAGMDLAEPLAPGEKRRFYIPCGEDDVETLTGELVWRVQFRKGHAPTTSKGVTTLIDVRFHADDVRTVEIPDV